MELAIPHSPILSMNCRFYSFLFILITSLFVHAQDDEVPEADDAAVSLEEIVDYRLQINDSITMTMFGQPTLTRSALIGKSGTISFHLIDSVKVTGLTVPELEEKLTELYQKDYFVDPKISVIITNYARKNVIVSGAVTNPGGVPYPDEGSITLAQAIAASGGINELANSNKITIVRKKGGDAPIVSMDRAAKIELFPGDTALVHYLPVVDQKELIRTATITGNVNRPGEISIPSAGKIDILSAIAKAGGLSRLANKKKATLRRLTPQGIYTVEEVLIRDIEDGKAAMVYIQEGDILVIRESIF